MIIIKIIENIKNKIWYFYLESQTKWWSLVLTLIIFIIIFNLISDFKALTIHLIKYKIKQFLSQNYNYRSVLTAVKSDQYNKTEKENLKAPMRLKILVLLLLLLLI